MTIAGTPAASAAPAAPDLDAFASAFTQFAADNVTPPPAAQPAETPAEDQPGGGEGQKVVETPAEGQPSAEATEGTATPSGGVGDAAGAEEDGEARKSSEAGQQPASGAPEPGAEGSKAPASDDDLLSRFAQIVADRAKQPDSSAQTQQPTPQQPAQQSTAPPLFTQEEQEVVEEYLRDYGEVERGAALIRRAEYQQLTSHVFGEITRVLGPFIQNAQAMMEDYHLQRLTTSIEDYDDIRDKVVAWAEKQPAYLQSAYRYVIERGTQDEIVDLVNRFKAETGTQAAPKAQTPQPKKEAELPATAKKAAASLAPVSTKRSNASGGSVDPADFDSAFAAFSTKEL